MYTFVLLEKLVPTIALELSLLCDLLSRSRRIVKYLFCFWLVGVVAVERYLLIVMVVEWTQPLLNVLSEGGRFCG